MKTIQIQITLSWIKYQFSKRVSLLQLIQNRKKLFRPNLAFGNTLVLWILVTNPGFVF